MPKYTLTEVRLLNLSPNETDDYDDEPEMDQGRIQLPVNEAILAAFNMGDPIQITVRGEVVELSKEGEGEYDSRNVTLKIISVEAYPEDEPKKPDDFETGFSNGYAERY